MAIRTFLFCDVCNPLAIRLVELRRTRQRSDNSGQRITDGRAWFDGPVEDAVADHGWTQTATGRHVCPGCAKRHPELL